MALIPVYHAREIAAYALIDDDAKADLSGYRWRYDRYGYVGRSYGGKRHGFRSMHREVMGLPYGSGPDVDHVNGDRLDNRRENLRLANDSENQQNRHRCLGGSSSYRGVTWNKSCGKWQAQASLNGRSYYLGVFALETEAAEVASNWRAEHMPFSPDARQRAEVVS